MNKHQLIEKVANATFYSEKSVEYIFDEIVSQIKNGLMNNEKITIKELGSLKIKDRASRLGRNPKTGEEYHIPARKMPVFEVSEVFKNEING